MKLYKTTITPRSNFATALKGDTLFGQLCWAINNVFGKNRLEELLSSYKTHPFLVVSDAFASGYLPKPHLPSVLLSESAEDRKENRKKIWLTANDLQDGIYKNAKKDSEVGKDNAITIVRNSINYKTFTTDDDSFAPYGTTEYSFLQKDIYFLIDENIFTQDELKKALEHVSTIGYGKDASIGKGRFDFSNFVEIKAIQSKSIMALGPLNIQQLKCKNIYYEPFVRFGKKGDARANKNPFKSPLLLANSGCVVQFEDVYHKPYIGSAITNFTSHNDIVHQGYSIAYAIKDIG